VHETVWSVQALADQSDSRRSLEEDLESFSTEPKWKENLMWDVRNLFLMPDARRSMEQDLEDLSAPDRGHGILETLRMFEW